MKFDKLNSIWRCSNKWQWIKFGHLQQPSNLIPIIFVAYTVSLIDVWIGNVCMLSIKWKVIMLCTLSFTMDILKGKVVIFAIRSKETSSHNLTYWWIYKI